MLDLATVTATEFEACLHETFTLQEEGKEYALELVEVRPLGHAYPGATRTPFALQFKGDARLRAAQRIYRLVHTRLGPMEIFLVQTTADPSGSYFEAIFS